ncbi:hypothetical protein FB45DRAFT_885532 [Roridomyces roridus]|uniref:C2H2-type domain-containing protein n=1 Tax=Roridomyces roridus TaxID=1738132 RepID=A0AAD7CHU8_9AGAR|nr:hypothetical protein FB45DRAFT_885532 [Roridomyces roridus]
MYRSDYTGMRSQSAPCKAEFDDDTASNLRGTRVSLSPMNWEPSVPTRSNHVREIRLTSSSSQRFHPYKPPSTWPLMRAQSLSGLRQRRQTSPCQDVLVPAFWRSASPRDIKTEPQDPPVPSGSILRPLVGTAGTLRASRARRKDPSRRGAFVCELCGHDFTAKHNLRNHMNSHNDVKKYECTNCGERFGTSHVLKRHSAKCEAGSSTRKTRSVSAGMPSSSDTGQRCNVSVGG